MPRLRSQTRITSVLPRELLQRTLEFLPFDDVHTEAKCVSRDFRSAARRALTRGRWQPMQLFSEQSLRHMDTIRANGVSAASRETSRAAWALEPGLVIFELAYWSRPFAGRFLAIVEPTIEGLPRIVVACECAQRAFGGFDSMYRDPGPTVPAVSVQDWALRLGHSLSLGYREQAEGSAVLDRETEDSLFFAGLESWTDPKLAAAFIRAILDYNDWFSQEYCELGCHWQDELERPYRQMHERWVENWRDRSRADAFVAEGVRLEAESQREQEEDLEEQLQAERGFEGGEYVGHWKWCPHVDKIWECPHCSDEFNAGFEGASGDDEGDGEHEEGE